MAYMMQLLSENSMQKYYIHYHSYFANHLGQALVALDRLGADRARIEHHATIHGAKLVPAEGFKGAFVQEKGIRPSNFRDIQGQSFYNVLDDYHRILTKEHRGSIPEFLAAEFPKISVGIVGDAFHGAIQLGYGLAAGHSETILEGVAWTKFSAIVPNVDVAELEMPYTPGTVNPVEVINNLRNDKEVLKTMLEGEKELEATVPSKFNRRLLPLIKNKNTALKLLHYVNQLAIPGFPSRDPGRPINTDAIGKALVHLGVLIYTTAKIPNDFFLLHGVTAGWSIRNILHYMEEPHVIDSLVRVFLLNLLATYLVQDSPELDLSLIPANQAGDTSWDEIKRDVLSKDRDEHMYKLVQVAWDMSNEDPDNDLLYKSAAIYCLKHPYEFGQFEATIKV